MSRCKYTHDRVGKDDISQFSKTFQSFSYIYEPCEFSIVVQLLTFCKMKYLSILFLALNFVPIAASSQNATLNGAWKNDDGVMIITGGYFTFTAFSASEFKYTYGGLIKTENRQVELLYEYHTLSPEKVGSNEVRTYNLEGATLKIGDISFDQIDSGTPGMLKGSWLFANRMNNGQLGEPRSADNPRKTMKILSGTRFQWIAFNTETKEFFGTGGGTYTTIDGKYTENIDFFSRDNSRVGASLIFDFELIDDAWHHQGLSSRGEPIHEIWERRK
jgi:hypothetical protein